MPPARPRARSLPPLLCATLVHALLAPSVAQAYLDPATGSAIIQMVLAGVMGALFALKTYWQNVKNFFNRSAQDEEAPTIHDVPLAGDDED